MNLIKTIQITSFFLFLFSNTIIWSSSFIAIPSENHINQISLKPNNLETVYHSTTLDALPLIIQFGIWAKVGKGVIKSKNYIDSHKTNAYLFKDETYLVPLVYQVESNLLYLNSSSWESSIAPSSEQIPPDIFIDELLDLNIQDDSSLLGKTLSEKSSFKKVGNISPQKLDINETLKLNRRLNKEHILPDYALAYLEFLLLEKPGYVPIFTDFNENDIRNVSFNYLRNLIRIGHVVVFRGKFYYFPKSADLQINISLLELKKHLQRHGNIWISNEIRFEELSSASIVQNIINRIFQGILFVDQFTYEERTDILNHFSTFPTNDLKLKDDHLILICN